MIRLRRSRVVLFLTVFVLLGLYYLIDTRGFGGRSSSLRTSLNAAGSDQGHAASDVVTGRKPSRGWLSKSSKSGSQLTLAGDEDTSDADDDVLEFPHRKSSTGPALDEKLPKGKHDPSPTTTTEAAPPYRFTEIPENFPVPEDEVITLPTGRPKAIPRIQHSFARETTSERRDRLKKLKKLKKVFLKHWAGYKEYAWDHDELRPVSGGFQDPFAGWRATLVDTLDMLWMMGLKDEFDEAVDEVSRIDFKTTQKQVLPLFEVAIRYMGGLIAAYDISENKYPTLLVKAEELAEVLMGAFDTPNRMPKTFYHWHTDEREAPTTASPSTVLAEIGSLTMEFIRMAQITQNNRYYDAVARITDEFEIFQNNTKLPGLWPLSVDATGGCTAGEVVKDRLEAETGTTMHNEGTVSQTKSDRATDRKINDVLEDGSAKLVKTSQDLRDLKMKDKSGSGSGSPSIKVDKPTAFNERGVAYKEGKDAMIAEVLGSQPPTESSDGQESDKTHTKRAPPRYHDDAETSDETNTVDSSSARKSKIQPYDKSITGSKASNADGKSPAEGSHANSGNYEGKTSFADDDADEPERPSSKDSSSKLAMDKQSKSKSAMTDAKDDDVRAAGPGKKATEESTYHEETKQKDKSSFGDDVGHQSKRPYPEDKSKGKLHKDATSSSDDSVTDSESVKTPFRHNKPMHKCVTKGLQSAHGGQGQDKFTLGGMADSVYEYLPKTYLLLGGLEPQYQRMHESAMSAMKEYLLFRTMTESPKRPVYFTGDYVTSGLYNNETARMEGNFIPHTGHLTCFQGAFIGLAARAFRNEKDVELARRLTDGCVWAYEQMPTGIMPELFDMVPCVNLTGPCKFNETRWWQHIDPWAKDKVAVNVQMAADADKDAIAAAKGSGSRSSRSETMNKHEQKVSDVEKDKVTRDAEVEPTKVRAHHMWDYLLSRNDNSEVPSVLNHLADKRRPPTDKQPVSGAEAQAAAEAQPTTVADYMERSIKTQHLKPGITKMNAREYILRPEAIESVFYMYRITGDPYFREKGWKMFEAIDNATSTTYGNSAIEDVSVPLKDVRQRDKAESFWTAETLKYFWLLFSEPDLVSLDDWVFNTEAHPFRRPDLDVKREREAEQVRRRKGAGGGMVWDLD